MDYSGIGGDSSSDRNRGQNQTPGLFTPSNIISVPMNREQGHDYDSSPYHDRLPDNSYHSSYSANESSSSSSNRNDTAVSQPYRPEGEYSNHNMVGLGNPYFAKTEKSWIQLAREKVSSAGSTVTAGATGLASGNSTPAKWILNNISSLGSRGSADEGRGSSLILPHEQDFSEHTNDSVVSFNGSQSSFASSIVSADRTRYRDAPGNPGEGTVWAASSVGGGGGGGAARPVGTVFGRGGTAASDGEYERVLVASLCEPGGLKATPADDTLKAFLLTAVRLSPELIGASLIEQLNSDHWQSRNKALVVIGSFGGVYSGCEDHVAWWRRKDSIEAVESMLLDSKTSVRAQASRTVRAIRETDSSEVSSADLTDADRISDSHAPESHVDFVNVAIPTETKEVCLIDWEELVPQIPASNPIRQPSVHSSSPALTFTSQEDELREQMEIAMLLDMDDGYHVRTTQESVRAGSTVGSSSSSIFDQMALSTNRNDGDKTSNGEHSMPSRNGQKSGGRGGTRQNLEVTEEADIFAGLTVLPTPAPIRTPAGLPTSPVLDIFNDSTLPKDPIIPSQMVTLVPISMHFPSMHSPQVSQQLSNQYQQQHQYQYQPGPAVDAALSGLSNTSWTSADVKGRMEAVTDTGTFLRQQNQELNAPRLSISSGNNGHINSSSLNFMKGTGDGSNHVYQPGAVDVNSFFVTRPGSTKQLGDSGSGDIKFRDFKSQKPFLPAPVPVPSATQGKEADSFSFLSDVLKNSGSSSAPHK